MNQRRDKADHAVGRLLVYTENHFPGGGNRYLVDMVNALGALYEDVLIVSNPEAFSPPDLKRLNVRASFSRVPVMTFARAYHRLRGPSASVKLMLRLLFLLLSPLVFLYDFLLFLFCLARFRPATVLCCSGGYPSNRSTAIMLMAARCCGAKTALSLVSMPTPRRRLFYVFDRLMDRVVWRAAQVIIVNARAIAGALADLHDLPHGRACVVYNGLEAEDSGGLLTGSGRKAPTRSYPHDGRIVIGCVARLDQAKGALILFEAFARLAERCPLVSLLLVGHGDASERLTQEVGLRSLGSRVCLAGYFEGAVEDLLSGIDIYVFPSFHEGFPYSVLEAMRAGCPIVASRVGGIPEAIDDGRTGLLVEPGSVEALQRAVETLIGDPAMGRRLGDSARLRFMRDFTLEAMGRQLVDLFSRPAP